MAAPYALDFSPLSDAIESNRREALLRNKLAIEQGDFAMRKSLHPGALAVQQEAIRHAGAWNPLLEKEKESDIAQKDLLDPYDLIKRRADAEAAKEGLDVTRQYRREQGFAVPNVAARLPTAGATGAAPTAPTSPGTKGTPIQWFAPPPGGAGATRAASAPAQAAQVADFVENNVLKMSDTDPGLSKGQWEQFKADPAIAPRWQQHVQAYGAPSGNWVREASDFVRDMRHEANGNVLRPWGSGADAGLAQAPQQQAAAPVQQAPASPAAAEAANRPLFPSIGGAMKETERMAAVPGMSAAAEAKFKTLQGIVEKGYMPTQPGSRDQVMPLTGSAETQARAAGLKQDAEKVGEARATAQINLPDAINSGTMMVRNIEAVLKDPALENVTGVMMGHSWMPTMRQDSADVEARVKQLLGGTFMQAYNSLKGGGQITEVEGAKATDSIARLGHLRVSTPQYKEALREARGDIVDLMHLSQAKAAGQGPAEAARIGVLREARSVIADNTKSKASDADKAAALEAIKARLTQNGIDPSRL